MFSAVFSLRPLALPVAISSYFWLMSTWKWSCNDLITSVLWVSLPVLAIPYLNHTDWAFRWNNSGWSETTVSHRCKPHHVIDRRNHKPGMFIQRAQIFKMPILSQSVWRKDDGTCCVRVDVRYQHAEQAGLFSFTVLQQWNGTLKITRLAWPSLAALKNIYHANVRGTGSLMGR